MFYHSRWNIVIITNSQIFYVNLECKHICCWQFWMAIITKNYTKDCHGSFTKGLNFQNTNATKIFNPSKSDITYEMLDLTHVKSALTVIESNLTQVILVRINIIHVRSD